MAVRRLSPVIDAAERSGKINLRFDEISRAFPSASPGAIRQAIHRQELRGRLVRLSRGSEHWLIVPLQYSTTKAPPLEMWLDRYLSKTLGLSYYVGLLSAAETYGVSPYGVMVTQVMVSKPRRPVTVGRHRLIFVTRTNLERIPTRWHETPDGRFKVSTPEITALDLVRRVTILGGIARVRDVLNGLWEFFTASELSKALQATDEVVPAQRIGALLEMDGRLEFTEVVSSWLQNKTFNYTSLSGRATSRDTLHANDTFKVWLDINDASSGT